MRVKKKCCHGDAVGAASTHLKICVSMRAQEKWVWQLYRARTLVLPPVGRRALRPGSHRPILCRTVLQRPFFSEQTERKLILLLDATLLGTRLKPCPPIARVLSLNRLYSSSNGNTRFRKPQALSSVFAALSRYSPGPSAF